MFQSKTLTKLELRAATPLTFKIRTLTKIEFPEPCAAGTPLTLESKTLTKIELRGWGLVLPGRL